MKENIGMAFQGIWSHKLRSFLTMLGIIIGIASIITIISTIKGTNEKIKENLIGRGNNVVTVQLYQDDSVYDLSWNALPAGVSPISEEMRDVLTQLGGVQEASLYLTRSYTDGVYYQNTAFNGMLNGIDDHYFSVYGYQIAYGRGFSAEEYTGGKKVVILDTDAASSLFSGESPLGKTVEIQGKPFVVIGVVSSTSSYQPEINNLAEYYTYYSSTGGKMFVPSAIWPEIYQYDEPQSVAIKAADTDQITAAGKNVADFLTANQIADPDTSNFSYQSENLVEQAQKLQQLSTSTNSQLIWIAGISLLVGGIGVMNIMLVSVTERTQEIGLKKAIGARKKRIMWQFLTEAAVLTFLGGILGVAGGIVMAKLISSIIGTPTAISIPAIAISVVFSIAIGLVFGSLPAAKAANLKPIDALRRE